MNGATIAVLVAAGVVATANWWSRWRDDARLELITKPAVTALLIAASLTIDADPAGARPWFTAALTACLAGDILLLPRVNQFLGGLVAFLVGHVLFAAGALVMDVRWAWTALPLVVIAGLSAFVVPPIVRRAGSLAAPVVVYFAVISAAGALLALTGRAWAVVGAAAFVTSDSILGWNKFVGRQRWAPVAIMVTYHAALAMLVVSVVGPS